MSNLVVLVFDGIHTADDVLKKLRSPEAAAKLTAALSKAA